MCDHVGVANRHLTGVEPLLWGSDYPHPEGTYPNSRRIVDELFEDVAPDERAAMLGGTATKLYGVEPVPSQ